MLEEMVIRIQQLFARSLAAFVAFVACLFVATIFAQLTYTPPDALRSKRTAGVIEASSPDAAAVAASESAYMVINE